MLNRTLADLVDSCIPYAIWRSAPTPPLVARARTLVAVLLFAILLLVATLALLLAVQLLSDRDFTPALVGLTAITIALVAQHLLFQLSANLQRTGALFSITFFLSLCVATSLTGAWRSPVLPLLFCTPIMVFLISGWRAAEYAVLLTFASGMGFMVIDTAQISLPYLMHAENFAYAQGVVWFMACIILVMLFATQKWVHGLDSSRYGASAHNNALLEDTSL